MVENESREEGPVFIRKSIEDAVEDSEIPKLYSNGFINAHGNGDVMILLQQNGKSIALLNLSFTMAKTLALKLGDVIKHIEDASGNMIMTTNDIDKAVAQSRSRTRRTNV